MIIGITGHARHGKDTCGNFIKDILQTDNVKLHSFARPMKTAAMEIFGWDYDYIEKHKEDVDPYYGISPRQFLQVLGTDFAQFYLMEKFPEFAKVTGRNLWVKRAFKNMRKEDINIITDVRFKHEVDAIRDSGQKNIIIKVVRPDWLIDNTHVSEQEIDTITPDVVLLNDSTLSDFKTEVYEYIKTIYKNLTISKKIYISGPITGKEDYNRVEFNKATEYLQSKGHKVVTPFDVTCPREEYTWEDYMKLDIGEMLTCDAVYLLNGWEESKGAKIEKRLAEEVGLAVYYQDKGDI